MGTFAVMLVLSACAVHASWNLMAGRLRAGPALFRVANAFVVIVLGGPFILREPAGRIRITASMIILAGLLLIALSRT